MSRGDEPITDPASPSPELAEELARLQKQLGDIARELEAMRDEAETRLSALQGELEDIAFGISKLEASIASAQATRADEAAELTAVEVDIAPAEESGAEQLSSAVPESSEQPDEEAAAEPAKELQAEKQPAEEPAVPAAEAEAPAEEPAAPAAEAVAPTEEPAVPAAEAEAEEQDAEQSEGGTKLAETEPNDEPEAAELHAEAAEEPVAEEPVAEQPEVEKQPAAEAKGESPEEAVVAAAIDTEVGQPAAGDKGDSGLEDAKSDEAEEAETERISADTKAAEHDAVVRAEAEKVAAAAATDVARAMLVDLALDAPPVPQKAGVEVTEQGTLVAGNKIERQKSSEEASFDAILEQEFAEYFESSAPAQPAPTTTAAASNEDESPNSVDDEWA